MPAGRPTDYNQDIANAVCEWIAGGQSLRAFCRQDGTPALSSITLWIVTHQEFSAQYRTAREAAGYAHADDILDVAQKAVDGVLDPKVAKVVMDGKKWAAERMAPKAHSAQQKMDHTSSDGSMSPKAPADVDSSVVAALVDKLTN